MPSCWLLYLADSAISEARHPCSAAATGRRRKFGLRRPQGGVPLNRGGTLRRKSSTATSSFGILRVSVLLLLLAVAVALALKICSEHTGTLDALNFTSVLYLFVSELEITRICISG